MHLVLGTGCVVSVSLFYYINYYNFASILQSSQFYEFHAIFCRPCAVSCVRCHDLTPSTFSKFNVHIIEVFMMSCHSNRKARQGTSYDIHIQCSSLCYGTISEAAFFFAASFSLILILIIIIFLSFIVLCSITYRISRILNEQTTMNMMF